MNQYYKTKICPFYEKGSCKFGKECQFAHSIYELRNKENLTKTKICPYWKASVCNDINCKYAHSKNELKGTSDFFKTRLCTYWQKGQCNDNEHCRHAHGISELRSIPGQLSTQPEQSWAYTTADYLMNIARQNSNGYNPYSPLTFDYSNTNSKSQIDEYLKRQNLFQSTNIYPLSFASTDTDITVDSNSPNMKENFIKLPQNLKNLTSHNLTEQNNRPMSPEDHKPLHHITTKLSQLSLNSSDSGAEDSFLLDQIRLFSTST